MATLADPGIVLSDRAEPRFYLGIAITCLTVAVVGFAPTYWIPLVSGRLAVPWVVHVHAVVFHGWLVLFVSQAWLATTGRFDRHRRMGLAGIALATAMLFVGLDVATTRLALGAAAAHEEAVRRFSVVPLMGIVVFASMIAVAIANAARRPDVHKRVLIVATAGTLNAAVGRIVRLLLAPPGGAEAGPPPVAFSILPGLIADLIIVAAMIYDKRTRGAVHPAYWIAGAVLLAEQLLRVPISNTDAWMAFTRWLVP